MATMLNELPAETAQDTEDEAQAYFQSQTPEGLGVAGMKQEIEDEDNAELDATGDAAYQSLNGEGPDDAEYDYRGMVRGGHRFHRREDGEGGVDLPNQYFRKNQHEVAGHDMATGEKVRDKLPDPHGLVAAGVRGMRGRTMNTQTGPDLETTADLTKIGVAHIQNGGSYEDFKALVPSTFNEEHMSAAYRVADDYVQKQAAIEFMGQDMPVPSETPIPSWDLTDDDLRNNELWVRASMIMYRHLEGEEFTGEPEELFQLAKETMALTNWSVADFARISMNVMNGPDEMKRAYWTLMQLYENKDTGWDDVLNNIISLGVDPASYASLGLGKIAIKGGQKILQREFSKKLALYISASATAGGEGGAYTGVDAFQRQMLELDVGAREDYDAWQTAVATGTGVVVGASLGVGLVAGGTQLMKYGSNLRDKHRATQLDQQRTAEPPSVEEQLALEAEIYGPPTVDDVQGRGVSSIDIIDQADPVFVPDPNSYQSPNKQGGNYLQQRADASLQGRQVHTNTAENRAFIAGVMEKEVLAEILKDKSKGRAPSSEWYRNTLHEAREMMATEYPEILSDIEHRHAFDFGLAVTSNGKKVSENTNYGKSVYEYWRQTGRMPESADYGTGKEGNQIVNSFKQYNILLDAWGPEKLRRNLATEFTVGDLRKAGFDISDELVGEKLPLSVIFGSKIGGGFYSNLQGDWDRLTPDRWFARTWGRMTGTMVTPNKELAAKHNEEFIANYSQNRKLIRDYLGEEIPLKKDLTPEIIDEMGQRVFAKWSRAKGPKGESFPDKSNKIHTLSRAIDKRLAPREGPANGAERKMMRETVNQVVESLREQGHDVTTSGVQAILWFPEQRLWDELGSKQLGKENDYAKATKGLLGLGDDWRGSPGSDPGTAGTGRAGGASQASREPALTEAEQGRFLKRETLRNLRAGARGQHSRAIPADVYVQPAKPAESVLLGGKSVPVVRTHTVRKNKNSKSEKRTIPSVGFEQANVTTEPWHELAMGFEADAAFNKAITNAKTSLGDTGAAVYVYPAEDLANSKKFLSADGKSGFAIKNDGDIVSVFNSSDRPGASIAALQLAVQNGGTKLDAFDIALPHIYALAGFKVVRREKWNQEFMPEGWNRKYFEKQGFSGTPDVVYMEYDPQSSGIYTPGEGQ